MIEKSASANTACQKGTGENSRANGPDDRSPVPHDGPKELRELIPALLLRGRRTDTGRRLRFALAVVRRRLFRSRPNWVMILPEELNLAHGNPRY